MKKKKTPLGAKPKQKLQHLAEKSPGTPNLDAWVQQTLEHRAKVEEWCNQSKTQRKKSEAAVSCSKESRDAPSDAQKLLDPARQPAVIMSTSVGVTAEARLTELLELLWADVNLWQSIHDGDSPSQIGSYISQKHGLRFPMIPLAVWREIARRPESRNRLFQFHRDASVIIGREIHLHGGGDFLTVWHGLESKLSNADLGGLFWEFLFYPALDHRHAIAGRQFSVNELEALRLAALKFATELKWCAANPNIVPPPLAANPSHRKSGIERARSIEQMVAKLLKNPALSNYQLAGSSPTDPKDAALKIAATARKLVELRECKSVINYSERRAGRTIGRKPSRFPKGC